MVMRNIQTESYQRGSSRDRNYSLLPIPSLSTGSFGMDNTFCPVSAPHAHGVLLVCNGQMSGPEAAEALFAKIDTNEGHHGRPARLPQATPQAPKTELRLRPASPWGEYLRECFLKGLGEKAGLGVRGGTCPQGNRPSSTDAGWSTVAGLKEAARLSGWASGEAGVTRDGIHKLKDEFVGWLWGVDG